MQPVTDPGAWLTVFCFCFVLFCLFLFLFLNQCWNDETAEVAGMGVWQLSQMVIQDFRMHGKRPDFLPLYWASKENVSFLKFISDAEIILPIHLFCGTCGGIPKCARLMLAWCQAGLGVEKSAFSDLMHDSQCHQETQPARNSCRSQELLTASHILVLEWIIHRRYDSNYPCFVANTFVPPPAKAGWHCWPDVGPQSNAGSIIQIVCRPHKCPGKTAKLPELQLSFFFPV